MQPAKSTRRNFLRRGVATGAAGLAVAHASPASYARVLGANERVSLGLIGCGGRGQWVLQNMVQPANANTALVAVCDVWKQRLAGYPAEAEKLYGHKPAPHADYRRLLDAKDVDAVIIATPDHQHAGQTIDAVQAGKHVYVEKPIIGIAEDLPTLNKLYDVVKASKLAVQHGTQGVSSPAARAVKQLIASGRLGRLFRVEGTETLYVPYWVNYDGPKNEADTDWKAWLYNRKPRPFDAHLHACWMGYWDITSGTIGGWMTHFINTVHYVTGARAPVSATAWGGTYAPTNDKRCDAPDNTVVMLDYAEGFHTQFTSHFGSEIDNERIVFMFEKGSVRCAFGHHLGNPVLSGEGTASGLKTEKLLDQDPPYPGAEHIKNWVECIRNGGEPNANMDYGYKQGISVIMGDLSCKLGCKVVFDPDRRDVRPAAKSAPGSGKPA